MGDPVTASSTRPATGYDGSSSSSSRAGTSASSVALAGSAQASLLQATARTVPGSSSTCSSPCSSLACRSGAGAALASAFRGSCTSSIAAPGSLRPARVTRTSSTARSGACVVDAELAAFGARPASSALRADPFAGGTRVDGVPPSARCGSGATSGEGGGSCSAVLSFAPGGSAAFRERGETRPIKRSSVSMATAARTSVQAEPSRRSPLRAIRAMPCSRLLALALGLHLDPAVVRADDPASFGADHVALAEDDLLQLAVLGDLRGAAGVVAALVVLRAQREADGQDEQGRRDGSSHRVSHCRTSLSSWRELRTRRGRRARQVGPLGERARVVGAPPRGARNSLSRNRWPDGGSGLELLISSPGHRA